MSARKNSSGEPVMLNAEQIAARRVAIEDAEINLGKKSNWHCHYCNRRFTNEGTFMKHFCEPKRRAQELMSPIGQAAFGYYRDWMRLRKFSQQGAAAFLESKYYRAFINFAQLVVNANIANPEKYIQLMIAGEIQPVLWCRDSAYSIYIDWSDKLSDPLEQVQQSVNYLFDICDKDGVAIENIFQHLGAQEILSLIRQRRLSPWFLFCSPKFGAFLKTMDKSQLSVLNAIINSSYWGERFQKEQSTVTTIKDVIKEIGL